MSGSGLLPPKCSHVSSERFRVEVNAAMSIISAVTVERLGNDEMCSIYIRKGKCYSTYATDMSIESQLLHCIARNKNTYRLFVLIHMR